MTYHDSSEREEETIETGLVLGEASPLEKLIEDELGVWQEWRLGCQSRHGTRVRRACFSKVWTPGVIATAVSIAVVGPWLNARQWRVGKLFPKHL